MSLRPALVVCAAVLFGCGGSPAAPATPAPEGSAAGHDAPAPIGSAPSTDAPKTDAPKADAKADAKPADKPAEPSTGKALEDVKMVKTTSAGGHYAVNVASVAGMSGDDVVRALGMKFDDCYAKLFKKQTGVNGKTTFDITISPKGKTQAVKLRSDDLKNAELSKCIEKIVKGIEWTNVTDAKAGAKTTVDWAVAGN